MSSPHYSPRIAPLPEPLPDGLAQRMAKLVPPGMAAPKLFLSVAQNADLFNFMVDSAMIGPTGLMDRRSLAKDVREAVILRTCVRARNHYEFNLHVQTISERMGLSKLQIANIKHDVLDTALWNPNLVSALALVDALADTLAVPDTVFAQARIHWSEQELIDITMLVGLYTSVAMLVGLIRPDMDSYRARPMEYATPDAP